MTPENIEDIDNEAPESTETVFGTNWGNPPKLSDLKQDYEDAKPDRDSKISSIDTWLDNLNIEGKAKVAAVTNRSSVAPKLIRKQAEWRYAALSEPFLSSPDVFNVDPVTFEDAEGARQNNILLNNQFNTKINKVAFFDEYVRTAVNQGTVCARISWEFEEEEREVSTNKFQYLPSLDPRLAQQYQQLQILAAEEPSTFYAQTRSETIQAMQLSVQTGQLMKPVYVGKEKEVKLVTTKNHPNVEICDYRNITIDPSCNGDFTKAKFVIQSFETSYAELKAEGKYKNLDSVNIDQSSILNEPDHASDLNQGSFNFSDKPRKRIVAHEYWGFWDIDNSGIVKPIIATWIGDTLIRLEDNPFPDKALPFVVVPYLPVIGSVYGEPDGALLEDNQNIVGAITRGMIDILGRSANGQTGTTKDALDITNKRKFDSGEDYEINPGVDPRASFYMHTYPEIPQSAQYMIDMQNKEAESMTGVKAFNQGITGSGLGESATSVRGALDAASKREIAILRRLADGIIQIGRKFISMNSEFLEESEVVRVTNEKFVTIRRDDLAGNYDLRLTVSTAEADNQKAQEIAFMLQTMGNNMGAEMSGILLSEVADLRKMPELANKIRNFEPTVDPLVQRKAELEIQLLEAQIANENSEAVENLANAELHRAKMPAEISKARMNNSTADIKDLDFIEQEGGTKQERDLQKLGAQAKGNILLKAFEKQLEGR